MNKIILSVLIGLTSFAFAGEPPKLKFPTSYRIFDPENRENAKRKDSEKLPPYIVVFPGGKNAKKADATKAIGRLEIYRGASKMFPESNDDKGLPVVLRGLRFIELKDDTNKVKGYEVELQGEFNAVKVSLPKETMQSLQDGKKTNLSLSH